jgi:predicted metal-dependent phosphoesterase TrpH
MLKVELHAHTSDDPRDRIPYTVHELIDRAARLGYQGLAITLHDRWMDVAGLNAYAQPRGVVLLSGIERTIEGKHVLLVNFGRGAAAVDTFADLSILRKNDPAGLVIAPHPFYPGGTSLRHVLERHPELFDAVEFNAFYTARLNAFNNAAVEWAARHGKPVVANTDLHRLQRLGTTYSLVDAEPNPSAICAAIKAGRVHVRTAPLRLVDAAFHFCDLVYSELTTSVRRSRPPFCAVE